MQALHPGLAVVAQVMQLFELSRTYPAIQFPDVHFPAPVESHETVLKHY